MPSCQCCSHPGGRAATSAAGPGWPPMATGRKAAAWCTSSAGKWIPCIRALACRSINVVHQGVGLQKYMWRIRALACQRAYRAWGTGNGYGHRAYIVVHQCVDLQEHHIRVHYPAPPHPAMPHRGVYHPHCTPKLHSTHPACPSMTPPSTSVWGAGWLAKWP